MSDFISRQDALKIIDNYIDGSFEWGAMMLKIKRLPTADVVPVVHGEWNDTTENWGWPKWSCSVCGGDGRGDYKYCPWCGADMRERREDGTA